MKLARLSVRGGTYAVELTRTRNTDIEPEDAPGQELVYPDGQDIAILWERDTMLRSYWESHPRYLFFRNLPRNARLLDVGAGPGGLPVWKEWAKPTRGDINLYAIDVKKGERFDQYVGYQLTDLNKCQFDFPHQYFDAMLMSHCLEHLAMAPKVLQALWQLMKPGGQIYVEIPVADSIHHKPRAEYQAEGLCICVTNFNDDITHVSRYTLSQLIDLMGEAGFHFIQAGIIENKLLQPELLKWGIDHADEDLTTFGIWLKNRFAQYCIGEREGDG